MNKIPHKIIYNDRFLIISHNPQANYLNFETWEGKAIFAKDQTINLMIDIMQHMGITEDDLR